MHGVPVYEPSTRQKVVTTNIFEHDVLGFLPLSHVMKGSVPSPSLVTFRKRCFISFGKDCLQSRNFPSHFCHIPLNPFSFIKSQGRYLLLLFFSNRSTPNCSFGIVRTLKSTCVSNGIDFKTDKSTNGQYSLNRGTDVSDLERTQKVVQKGRVTSRKFPSRNRRVRQL